MTRLRGIAVPEVKLRRPCRECGGVVWLGTDGDGSLQEACADCGAVSAVPSRTGGPVAPYQRLARVRRSPGKAAA